MTDRGNVGPERTTETPIAPDDEALGALVRDVAAGWTMPPRRIDEVTWRERVAAREQRRSAGGGRRRLLAAAGLAVAATIVLAVGAAWLGGLQRLPATGDASAAPGTATPAGTPGQASPSATAASPVPTMTIHGDPLPVSSLMLAEEGHRLLDLTTGRPGPALERSVEAGGRFVLRPGGGWTCVCFTLDRPWAQDPTAISVDLLDYDAAGTLQASRFLNTYDGGQADPEVRTFAPPVGLAVSLGERATRVYVGWTVRSAEGWQSGVDIVDLTAGEVVQKVHLPDLPLETGPDAAGRPSLTVAVPPTVSVAPDASRLVIAQMRGILQRDAAGIVNDISWSLGGHWGASIEAGEVGTLTEFTSGEGSIEGAGCSWPVHAGFAGSDVYVSTCGAASVLRRVDARDGRPLGDVRIDGVDTTSGSMVATPDGRRYAWFPFSRVLVEVDAIGGRIVRRATMDGPTAGLPGPGGPLGALTDLGRRLGRWIAPPALAKVFIEPAMALSPDGSRLYLLGVDGSSIDDMRGSSGVHVVDTVTLTETATWRPTADWVSIAVSGDGSLVYLAGAPGMGIDADGRVNTEADRPASLTVLDAASGQVRAVAGQLGQRYVLLDPTLVP